MAVDSVTEAVEEVSVAMGMGREGVPPETAGAGKTASDCKPNDPQGFCGGMKERSRCKIVHSQVLRIRKEDHRLGEDDVCEGLGAREKIAFLLVSTRMGVLFYARPILPSPLGTKAPIN